MEREEILALLSKIAGVWNDFEGKHYKDIDKFSFIKNTMPHRDVIDNFLEDEDLSDDIQDSILTCSFIASFIDDFGDMHTFISSYYSFLEKIGADRIIQKWGYYCNNGREDIFSSQEDKRNFHLKLIEIYDEIKSYKEDISKYCLYIGFLWSNEIFHVPYDRQKITTLSDICEYYEAKAAYILDLIKDNPRATALPKELDKDDFKDIIKRGIEIGLIEETPSGLKWNETKELLAYFAECISRRFGLSKKVDNKGNITISWKPFEALFGVKNLKEAKQNWMRQYTQFTPNRHENIDKLLDETLTHL